MDVMALARAERSDLADFLSALAPRQWESPTLCTGWTVRDVVAHIVSYEEHGPADLLERLRRVRFRPQRLNEAALADYRGKSPDELLEFLRTHLEPRGSTARFGGRVGLVDCLIHHQDIRRPLGMPRDVPADRLAVALPFAVWAPPLRGFWKARGARLVATDLDWAHGRGPEARGPAEAVLLALAGRGDAAAGLTG